MFPFLNRLLNPIRINDSEPVQATDFSNYHWYENGSLMPTIVESVVKDSLRNGFNIIAENEKIKDYFTKRIEELNLIEKVQNACFFSRIYDEGGLIYIGTQENLYEGSEKPIQNLKKIDFVNVIAGDRFEINDMEINPLQKDYNEPKISVNGHEIDKSRYIHLVERYNKDKGKGHSIVSELKDAVSIYETTIKAINTTMKGANYEVLVGDFYDDNQAKIVTEKLRKNKFVDQTSLVLPSGSSFERHNPSFTGWKDISDFIKSYISGISQIPSSRLFGLQQGQVTAGSYDIENYTNIVKRYQKFTIKPILEKFFDLFLKELNADEIYDIEFNSIREPSKKEEIEIQKIETESYINLINGGVLTNTEVREKMFPEMEKNEDLLFSENENENENETTEEPEKTDEKPSNFIDLTEILKNKSKNEKKAVNDSKGFKTFDSKNRAKKYKRLYGGSILYDSENDSWFWKPRIIQS